MTLLAPLKTQEDDTATAWARNTQPCAEPEIVLDLSRLLSRVLHPTPTGVDRVEMAYAQGLLRLAPARVNFAAYHPSGLHGRLPRAAVEDFLDLTAQRWDREGQGESTVRRLHRAALSCLTLAPRPLAAGNGGPRVYLYPSARGLERRGRLESALRREKARLVPFVHDLIPLEHPEYARPAGAERYARKLETVAALASGILCNSNATARALVAHLAARGRSIPVRAARLGATFHPDP
ncbi:MAG: glycosyltransferase family 1 protein, partial [Caulobacteraceae bacterium]